MSNQELKDLCLALMQADSEDEVINLLKRSGYWDDLSCWRLFGDNENNFSTIGNQKARPEDALVEKLVNAVDARLIDECWKAGIDPQSAQAPQSIRDAVARFFGGQEASNSTTAGLLREWSKTKRTNVAEGITLAATGRTPTENRGNPCFTICDAGEGQSPECMPDTLLSLARSYKFRIKFVQGKFHMGGTGVLKFCGRQNLQLIVSRRDQAIGADSTADPSSGDWGFTVVRRIVPQGAVRSSVYMYLAPLKVGRPEGRSGVLRFAADSLPMFPDGRIAYTRESAHGTLIKLYEYEATGCKSNILRADGLMSRVEVLLPELALPIRFHECRTAYRGHKGSFDTTLTGLVVRLEDEKSDSLEFPPSSCPMSIAGETMTATLYAFKRGKADTYRKNEGIVFTRNGQTHGHFTRDFFRRKQVGLSYLSDSLLVIVDCSGLSVTAGEDLFMNSRDRLSGGALRLEVEEAIGDWLNHHSGLRELSETRRRAETDEHLKDQKPLEDILKRVLRLSPTLSKLFLTGERISVPFKTASVTSDAVPFVGKANPTFFKFKDKPYGTELKKECHINMRCRVTFETDAVNDYFSRPAFRGEFNLHIENNGVRHAVEDYVGPNLLDGIATLNVQLPANCIEGDQLHFISSINDSTQLEPIENCFVITVKEANDVASGGSGKRKPPSKQPGDKREIAAGIQLPDITRVYATPKDGRRTWTDITPPFDKASALRVRRRPPTNGDEDLTGVFDFFINMDNLFLQMELKANSKDADVTATRFEIGMVLLGLALLQDDARDNDARSNGGGSGNDDERDNVEDQVEHLTRVIAPILIPMIQSLGSLSAAVGSDNYSGEDV